MKSVSKLEKAKAQIVLDHAFFSHILLRKKLIEDKTISTLAVDSRGNIYYNPDFVESLSVPQIVWGLCHEIGHVMGQHALRRKHREHKKWNYAGDAWINDMLDDCQVGERIPHTVNIPGSKDKTTEQIYDELPDDNSGGSGGGSGSSSNNNGDDQFDNGLGDDIKYEDLTESEVKEIEAQTKVEIAQAAQVAKMRGQLSGKLAEIVSDIIEVKTPWYDHLERYMVGMTKQDYTWTRPNRRFEQYLPSIGRTPIMGAIGIQVDVSGSISKQELDYYSGHLSRIIEQCKPSQVEVFYTDTKVVKHQTFQHGEEIKLTHYSGGGTDMCAGFKYLEENSIDVDVMVTLTDGCTPFPEDTSVPSVWCISSAEIKSPVGESVHFEINN